MDFSYIFPTIIPPLKKSPKTFASPEHPVGRSVNCQAHDLFSACVLQNPGASKGRGDRSKFFFVAGRVVLTNSTYPSLKGIF